MKIDEWKSIDVETLTVEQIDELFDLNRTDRFDLVNSELMMRLLRRRQELVDPDPKVPEFSLMECHRTKKQKELF